MPRPNPFVRTVKWASSAVAVLAIMAVVFVFFFGAGGSAIAGSTPQEVQHATIEMLESPFFMLDLENDRTTTLYDWLKSKSMPFPQNLPKGLVDLKGVGCRILEVGDDKSPGSLVCYRKGDKILHLVTVKNDALDCEGLEGMDCAAKHCHDCDKNEGWSMTTWTHEGYTFFLLSKMDDTELAKVF